MFPVNMTCYNYVACDCILVAEKKRGDERGKVGGGGQRETRQSREVRRNENRRKTYKQLRPW